MNYRPLGRKRRTFGGSSGLWLAPDHILLATSNLFTQTYRRFRLEDIQAFVVTRRPGREVLQYSILALIIVFLIGLLFRAGSTAGRVAIAVFFAPLLATSLVDIARGPRCRLTLVTAVTRLDLPPISRVNVAERILAELAPVLEAAQGPLPAEVRIAPTPASAARPPDLPSPGRAQWLYLLLFGAALVGGALSSVGYWFRLPDGLIWLPWYIAALKAVLGGYIVHHYRKDGWTPPRVLALVAAIAAALMLAASITAGVQSLRGAQPSNPASVGPMFQTSPDWFVSLSRIATPAFLVLGTVGLAMTVRRRRRPAP